MKFTKESLLLYAVTDRSWLKNQTLYEQVEQALQGGATFVQLREKDMEHDAFLAEAIEIRDLCRRYNVPFVIDDDVELALECDADGVHVGQNDLEAQKAREALGNDKIVGVTAKTVEQARLAQKMGADYLGSGAIFGTTTKKDAKPMTKQLLSEITASVSIPVVAIGGINSGNLPELEGTGIAGAAVVSGIFAAEDIAEECRLLRKQIEKVVQG